MSQDEHNQFPFPWDIGVYDAHCHPTDTMTSVAEIPKMKASTLTVMSTRGEDQELVAQTAETLSNGQQSKVIPCFGWHPWFSYQLILDEDIPSELSPAERKRAHYKNVLVPSPDNESLLSALPDPKPMSEFLNETRQRLQTHPTALVGEIGLDRAFRLPNPWTQQDLNERNADLTPGSREGRPLSPYRVHMDHQKAILKAQLKLAGELRRPVSVHSVQAHGAVFDILKDLFKGHERKAPSRKEKQRQQSVERAHEDSDAEAEAEKQSQQTMTTSHPPLPFPPRICMHSYSGPVDPLKQFLNATNPADVYFSFSSVINFNGPSAQKVIDAIRALPDDRLLIESDLHTAGQVMDDLLEEVARKICELRGWTLREGIARLAENWRRFMFGGSG